VACGKRALARAAIDRAFVVRGRTRRVRGIPALVCGACGETFFDHVASTWVDEQLGIGRRKRKAA
jgi:YgiT-type zinc finger domain-containing protein